MKCLLFTLFTLLIFTSCSQDEFSTIQKSQNVDVVAQFNNQVDILWVIDNSFETMVPHQDGIADRMNLLYNELLRTRTDFRIAATTMDMRRAGERGKFIGSVPVVTNSTPNAVTHLRNMIRAGGEGSNTESGLAAMASALSREHQLGKDSTFLREEALLVVVFLTDDRDFSTGEVEDYYNYLNTIKGSNEPSLQRWVTNFIGITDLSDPACRTFLDYAAKGVRYIELANLSGGVSESICYSDFSSYMNQVTSRLMSVLSEYKLKNTPLLDSLRVYKNGALVRQDSVNGWTYNETRNSIQFHGSESISPTDKIKIDYEPINRGVN